MTNNMIKWLELDEYINDNRKFMTNEEYQEYVKELYRLFFQTLLHLSSSNSP